MANSGDAPRRLPGQERMMKLDPLLPLTRIAAGMKTSDNQEGIGLDEKKERVGKFLRARPPESLKDDGKLPGIVGHALHDTVDSGAKAVA
jgi:hypothetical protein